MKVVLWISVGSKHELHFLAKDGTLTTKRFATRKELLEAICK